MTFLERVSKGSDVHTAEIIDDTVQLSPIDSSEEALKRFQPIALEAIRHEGEGYEIFPAPAISNSYPGNLYCFVVLLKSDGRYST